MKKTFQGMIVLFAALVVTSVSCRKADKPRTTDFDIQAAKEWYYAVFKKSPSWSRSPLHGKKLPDWRYGKYLKVGNTEIVVFPLKAEKKAVSIASSPGTPADNFRIAEASISKIAFIRKPGKQIVVREINFIPDPAYLTASGFDISDVTLGNTGAFTGRAIVKTWDGATLSRWQFTEGKITKRGKAVLKPSNGQDLNTPQTENCTFIEVCEYEQNCTEWWQGDIFLGEECGPWTPTGFCWLEEYCEEEIENCGPEFSAEECLCEVYDFCDDGDEQGEDNCSNTFSLVSNFTPTSTLESVVLESENAVTRVKLYKWKIAENGLSMWRFYSHEKGIHQKVNNEWRWESLTHQSISREGMVLGSNVQCILNNHAVELGLYNAIMALDCTLSSSMVCRGSPVQSDYNFQVSKAFNVNQ